MPHLKIRAVWRATLAQPEQTRNHTPPPGSCTVGWMNHGFLAAVAAFLPRTPLMTALLSLRNAGQARMAYRSTPSCYRSCSRVEPRRHQDTKKAAWSSSHTPDSRSSSVLVSGGSRHSRIPAAVNGVESPRHTKPCERSRRHPRRRPHHDSARCSLRTVPARGAHSSRGTGRPRVTVIRTDWPPARHGSPSFCIVHEPHAQTTNHRRKPRVSSASYEPQARARGGRRDSAA